MTVYKKVCELWEGRKQQVRDSPQNLGSSFRVPQGVVFLAQQPKVAPAVRLRGALFLIEEISGVQSFG